MASRPSRYDPVTTGNELMVVDDDRVEIIVQIPPSMFTRTEFVKARYHLGTLAAHYLSDFLGGKDVPFRTPGRHGIKVPHQLVFDALNEISFHRKGLDAGKHLRPVTPLDEKVYNDTVMHLCNAEMAVLNSMTVMVNKMLLPRLTNKMMHHMMVLKKASPAPFNRLPSTAGVELERLILGPLSIVPTFEEQLDGKLIMITPHREEVAALIHSNATPIWLKHYLHIYRTMEMVIGLLKVNVLLAEHMSMALPLKYVTDIMPDALMHLPKINSAWVQANEVQTVLSHNANIILQRWNNLAKDSINEPNANHAETFLPELIMQIWGTARERAAVLAGLSGGENVTLRWSPLVGMRALVSGVSETIQVQNDGVHKPVVHVQRQVIPPHFENEDDAVQALLTMRNISTPPVNNDHLLQQLPHRSTPTFEETLARGARQGYDVFVNGVGQYEGGGGARPPPSSPVNRDYDLADDDGATMDSSEYLPSPQPRKRTVSRRNNSKKRKTTSKSTRRSRSSSSEDELKPPPPRRSRSTQPRRRRPSSG